MPSAGSSFRRGGATGHTVEESAPRSTGRRRRKVEAMAVTIATALCALALGFIVVTLYQMSDDSQSAADARQPATLSLSRSSGTIGTTVVAKGTNFPRDAAVTFGWDGSAVGMPTVQASRNGSFQASFVVPATASVGRHRVSASGTRTMLNGTPITATVNAPFDVTAVSTVPTPTPVPPATPSFTSVLSLIHI